MKSLNLRWPATTAVALLAAFTTWISLFAWRGLVESPSGYLVPAMSICLLVAVSGMLMRSARVPTFLVPLGQAAVLVLWVTRSWTSELALGGWIPTPESIAEVGRRINGGSLAAQAYAAPVPDDAPIIFALLLAAAAGTALLVDFLAAGLRRVPLAGLPLLAVYTVPVSILGDGVPWWVFVASALGFLAMMAADESQRLVHWGRQISTGGPLFDSVAEPVSTQAVRASARKIGFTATGLALVVPILIPTFDTGLFGSGGSGPGGDGDAVSISNPMADFRQDLVRGEDTDWIWITTDDPNPAYLRMAVLDTFNGDTWKPSGRDIPVEQRADGRIPRPPGLEARVQRSEVPYTIQIGDDFRSTWLPTPYPVSAIDVPGDWRYDANTLDVVSAAKDQNTRNLDYSLTALEVDPTAEQLASARAAGEDVFTPYTKLPAGSVDIVQELAREVTDAAPTRFEKAVALQRWFRQDGGFSYSLDRSPGNGLEDLEQFLGNGEDGRVGYCEQFASAMAVMGRAIGIPSRVAVGFLRPSPLDDGTFVYSAHDLHAWPEMYFQGTGWVRFEPTPSDRARTVPGYTTEQLASDGPNQGESTAPSDAASGRDIDQENPNAAAVDENGNGGGGSGSLLPFFISLLVGFVVALVPRTARALVRRRRWARADSPAQVAEVAWSELRDSAIDLGVRWDDSVTLRARARDLVHSFGEPGGSGRRHDEDRLTRAPVTGPKADPEATHALERLVKHVERARYARSVEAQEAVAADVATCVAALRAGATRARRFRADWLPASLTDDLRTWLRSRTRDDIPVAAEPGVDHAV